MACKESIEERLAKARAREQKARQTVAKLKRAMSGADRRLETQRRCAIGGVVLAMATRAGRLDHQAIEVMRRYLADHPPHESNRDALRGTPLDLDLSWPPVAVVPKSA